jgi:ubiquinone/menaquinone biosynthesis C-methylase UbiE
MSKWEALDAKHAADMLVGDYYGDRPEDKLDMVRIAKKNRAALLCKKMGCNKESVVLEIGSGMGFTSKYIAQEVKHLYCSDISASFLEFARKECSGIPNIDFIKIDEEPATFSFQDEFFDIIFADAVFIHLNLYDIYWYFSEFQRLAKRHGTVFINIMNASRIDAKKLSEMAEFYQRDQDCLKRLLCWNSVDAVATIASNFGFKLRSKGRLWGLVQGATVSLLFSKR